MTAIRQFRGGSTRTGRRRPLYAIHGLDPVARVFQIADGLFRRGFDDRDVELVLGGNFRRVLGEIWPPGDDRTLDPRRDPFCPPPARTVPRPT